MTYQLFDCEGNLGGLLIPAVPEPSSLLLILASAGLLAAQRRS
jgi:hypothetical protein